MVLPSPVGESVAANFIVSPLSAPLLPATQTGDFCILLEYILDYT
jgi:hypothetical protein